ncbi:MAG: FeoB-associated Cys-rich membrane protein [Paludibacteraceae bacterium]|nr:FeoB-associated Cys-rich membrane protein [Paludibacteraceae bacterium]
MLSKVIGALVVVAAVYGLIRYIRKESNESQCAGCSLRYSCKRNYPDCQNSIDL